MDMIINISYKRVQQEQWKRVADQAGKIMFCDTMKTEFHKINTTPNR